MKGNRILEVEVRRGTHDLDGSALLRPPGDPGRVFVASEISLVSANRRRLHQRAEEGYRGAKMALKLLSRPEFLLATTLLGA